MQFGFETRLNKMCIHDNNLRYKDKPMRTYFSIHQLSIAKIILVLGTFFLFGCAEQLKIKPDVSRTDIAIVVSGKIDYSGNRDYLPNTIAEDNLQHSDIIIKYEHSVSYGGTTPGTDLITAFIPTTLLGTPTGNNELFIQGKLEIYKSSTIIKSYIAECVVEKSRSVWSGIDYSELRRRGLLAIKENIEMQMMSDKNFFSTINSKL